MRMPLTDRADTNNLRAFVLLSLLILLAACQIPLVLVLVLLSGLLPVPPMNLIALLATGTDGADFDKIREY